MKATYERQVVYRAAHRAVEHWQALFDTRRQEWIIAAARVRIKRWMFGPKFERGHWRASEMFDASSFFVQGGGDKGHYWTESKMLGIAKYLLKRTDRLGATSVTLDDEDIMVIRPVMKLASGAEA